MASALRRSRIARMASPGFEAFERSIFGLLSITGLEALLLRPPDWK
jgi:hypothetical protein